MLAWTFIALGVYLVTLFNQLGRILQLPPLPDGRVPENLEPLVALPDISAALMVLMGLGQGAYLGKKLVTVETPRLTSLSPSAGRPGVTVMLAGQAVGTETAPPVVTVNGNPLPTPASRAGEQWSFVFPPLQPDGSRWPAGQVLVGVLAEGRTGANTRPIRYLCRHSGRHSEPRSDAGDGG